MKKKKERKKQFYDAVIRTLYPPPEKDETESSKTIDAYHVPDDYESDRHTSSSDGIEEEEDGAGKKLTRAQRKRLRKKKLKQSASQPRRKMIGPQLPVEDAVGDEQQGVRQNASEEKNVSVATEQIEDDSNEEPSGAKRMKLKRRRMAKKMASDVWKLSSLGKVDEHE